MKATCGFHYYLGRGKYTAEDTGRAGVVSPLKTTPVSTCLTLVQYLCVGSFSTHFPA